MNTLAEIEAAAEALPPDEKEELILFLAALLRARTMAQTNPQPLARSKRGFPISKGRAPFTMADVTRIEAEAEPPDNVVVGR
jgi:hypothetical protein